MVVLSIELDLVAQIARLLTDTLEAAGLLVQQWRPRKWCNPRQPESLTSHLQHAAKVVWSSQTFLCRMIYLLCCFRKKDHPIRLNLQFCLDLEWWHTFLSSWNGVSSWLFPGMSPPPDIEVVSDASRSLGFSAYFNGAWFSSSWADLSQSLIRNIPSCSCSSSVGSSMASTAHLVSLRQWGGGAHPKF